MQIGLGSKVASMSTAVSDPGGSQATNYPFDLMINGDSMFVVSDGTQNFFTRAGNFTTDAYGNLVTSAGYSVVVPGVHIGSNVVIGAGSVVTKDIPDWSVAVGNPCRVVKKITEEDKQYYFKDRKFDDEAWEVIKDL